jgi:hypothetical protein
MIEQGLYTLLSTDATISGMVGDRISPVLLPEGSAMPAMTYQVTRGNSDPTFDTSGLIKLFMQFDCFGANYSDAAQLRKALVIALNGYYGTLSDGANLLLAQFQQPIDGYIPDVRQYRCAVEFYFEFTFPRT